MLLLNKCIIRSASRVAAAILTGSKQEQAAKSGRRFSTLHETSGTDEKGVAMSSLQSTGPVPTGRSMLEASAAFTLLMSNGIDPILAFVLAVGATYLLHR